MKQSNIEKKRLKEKTIVTKMIQIYCKGHKHVGGVPCKECQELIEYANLRSDKCPFMETKTFCSNCKVHCYKPDMKEKIKDVMRYSGPRMLLYHPIATIHHLILDFREKRRIKKEQK